MFPVLAAVVCGCGGGGGGPANPFAGSYAGSGVVTGSPDKIETYLGVGNDGTLCGALKDEVTLTRATYGGSVGTDGTISRGTIQLMDSNGKSTGSGTVTGTIKVLSTTSTGNVTVSTTINALIGKTTVTYTFTGLQGQTATAIRAKKKKKKKA